MSKNNKPSQIGRYQKVISVLMKYGFEDVVAHPPLSRLIPKSEKLGPKRAGKSVFSYTRYERVRMICEDLGTTYMKFAQIASNRPDLLPEELLAELEKLQDSAPPVAEEKIKQKLEIAYGKSPEEIFQSIDSEPIASASVAQVHRAVLKNGKEVVLKIQRPNIRRTIEADIAILKTLAGIIERFFSQYSAFQPMELVNVFENTVRKELRFTLEASNIQRFQKQFGGKKGIHIPEVYPEYSTDKVLCMEYIEGVKITDLDTLKSWGLDGKELAHRGVNLYFEQIFTHGFFHGDPHPGNILIQKDGTICLVDYGIVGSLSELDKKLLSDILVAIGRKDVKGLKKALMNFARDGATVNSKALEYELSDFLLEYFHLSLDQIDIQDVFNRLNRLFFEYHIKIPSNLLLLLKTLVIVQGVGLKLDPGFNLLENIQPYAFQLLARQYSPIQLYRNFRKSFADLSRLAVSLPEDLEDVIQKIKEGKLHIEFEHKGLDDFYQKIEVISNRLSLTILLAALILGSSLLVLADIPPRVNEIPLFGIIGFGISGILAFGLLIRIIRHRNY